MLNAQDKRAIETMAQCGCELDALCTMFPQASKDDIVEIWNYIWMKGHQDMEADDANVSINCS